MSIKKLLLAPVLAAVLGLAGAPAPAQAQGALEQAYGAARRSAQGYPDYVQRPAYRGQVYRGYVNRGTVYREPAYRPRGYVYGRGDVYRAPNRGYRAYGPRWQRDRYVERRGWYR